MYHGKTGLTPTGQSDAHKFYQDMRVDCMRTTIGTDEGTGWRNLVIGSSITLPSTLKGEPLEPKDEELGEISIPIGMGAHIIGNGSRQPLQWHRNGGRLPSQRHSHN